MTKKEYLSPYVESIELEPQKCVMASAGVGLGDMGENPIIDNSIGDSFGVDLSDSLLF